MIDSLLEFIKLNSSWGIGIVFLIAFLESLLIIGLFLPGWLLLFGVGSLIGANILGFYPIVMAAYLGALVGEYISFHLGYHYHQSILNWPFVAKQKKLIDSSHVFFERHGVAGVFFGRFFGPTRSVVPFLAGISEMSKKTFLWVNCLSAIIWAPLYLIPGILVGAAFTIDKQQSYYLLFVLTMLGLWLAVVVKYNKKILVVGRGKSSLIIRLKAILSIAIFIALLFLFVASPHWILLQDILSVLWQLIK